MAIDPFWGSVGAAGISSAFGLAGGLLSRPKHSQRDLMYIQDDIWRKQMGQQFPLMTQSMRNAGLNPVLAASGKFGGGPQVGGAPAPYTDPAGAAVSNVGNSAAMAYRTYLEMEKVKAEAEAAKEMPRRIRAETENIASQTNLNSAKAVSEFEQPGVLQSVKELNSARSDLEKQRLQREIVETAIKEQDLTVAEKDAVIAAIDIDLYASTVGEISRWLSKLGISGQAAVGMAHFLWNMARQKARSK